ncbi:MAG: hypothetical protein H3C64_04210, partial [Candidatus Kuenenia stuttgartiensis]|nr:hypothetical protein [Candidatus Kuenenia stuttgartiensis]
MKNVAIYTVTFLLAISCNTEKTNNEKLDKALDYAGTNAGELKKVIAHYSKASGDSLKLQAAIFLIENMPGKGCIKYSAITDCGTYTKNLFIGNGIGIDSINKLKKKIENSLKCGEIRFSNPVFLPDIKIISAKQLIENIDYAFKAWQLPWAKTLTFKEFKEYILPYRVQSEPLQTWRKKTFE